DILVELVKLDEDDADDYLKEQDFTKEQRESVLEKTHCPVREDYYITSGDMVGKAGVWAHFGLWDFQKAYVISESTKMTRQVAVDDLVDKFDMTEDQAKQLYSKAIEQRTESQKNAFVSPWPGYITAAWKGGCKLQPDNETTVCPLGIGVNNQNGVVTALDIFAYNSSQPNMSILRYTSVRNGVVVGSQDDVPGVIIVAGEGGLEEIKFSNSMNPQIGMLFDAQQNRILVGDPALLRSVFTQLYYLEGRYNQYFDKFDDRTSVTGLRILTWKVNWDAAE
ncbi:hypothetical protein GOV11_05430, partial [Candidatus Woesearchaeota archaeon]|nr:hypothetical protein [Candidatus Woesearchaeota archaeon]